MSERQARPSVGLWILLALLALLFLFSGGSKLVMSAEEMAGPVLFPLWFLRFIGVAEMLGGLGLILPAITGIKPGLTRLAAILLLPILIGAVVTTLMGEPKALGAFPFVTLCVTAYIVYARRTA